MLSGNRKKKSYLDHLIKFNIHNLSKLWLTDAIPERKCISISNQSKQKMEKMYRELCIQMLDCMIIKRLELHYSSILTLQYYFIQKGHDWPAFLLHLNHTSDWKWTITLYIRSNEIFNNRNVPFQIYTWRKYIQVCTCQKHENKKSQKSMQISLTITVLMESQIARNVFQSTFIQLHHQATICLLIRSHMPYFTGYHDDPIIS